MKRGDEDVAAHTKGVHPRLCFCRFGALVQLLFSTGKTQIGLNKGTGRMAELGNGGTTMALQNS
jgi:hypothetical protein